MKPLTADEPRPRATTQERVAWLDGIRGAAATFVVLHHMWLAVWPGFPRDTGPWWLSWLLYGHLAVAVFIVVSGFSLALAPMRDGGELRGGVRRFVRRRAWRIIPAYWAALILSTIVTSWLLRPELGPGEIAKSLLVHGLLLQDAVQSEAPNGAFWSIAVEWQIYFVFPLILLVGRLRSLELAVVLTLAVVLAGHALAGQGAPFDKIDHLSPQFLALFALGVLAVKLGRGGGADRLRRSFGAVAAVAVLAVVGAAIVQGSEWTVENYFWVDLVFGLGVAAALCAVFMGGVPRAGRVLASRPSLRVGLFSYSIYLIHGPIVGVLEKYAIDPLGLPPLAQFGVFLAFGLPLILWLSYRFHLLFEAPFLRARDRSALRTMPLARLVQRGRAPGRAVPAPAPAPAVEPIAARDAA